MLMVYPSLLHASTPVDPEYTECLEYESSLYKRYLVTYKFMGESIPATYFIPAGTGPFPAVVVVHGIFSTKRDQFWSFGREAAKHGIAVLMPSLPFHHERKPTGALISGQGIVDLKSTDATVSNIKRAVDEVSQGVDWLSSRPEIDTERLGCAGLSLGAVVASLALKADSRFLSGAIVVGGAGLDELFDTSNGFTVGMIRLAADLGFLDIKDIVSRWSEIDPKNFGTHEGLRILMLNGLADDIFPIYNARLLENSWKNLEYQWTDSTHDYPQKYGEVKVADWFRKTLGGRSAYNTNGVDIKERLMPEVNGEHRYTIELTFSGLGTDAVHRFSAPLIKKRAPVLIGTQRDIDYYRQVHGELHCAFYELPDADSINMAYAARFLVNSEIPDLNRCFYIHRQSVDRITVSSLTSAELSGLFLTIPRCSIPYNLSIPDSIDRTIELEQAARRLDVRKFAAKPNDEDCRKKIPSLFKRIWRAAHSAITFTNDWLLNLHFQLFYY